MIWKNKKIYQESNIGTNTPVPNTFKGSISDSTVVDPANGCSTLTLDSNVFIQTQNTNFITNGDIVYIDAAGTSPFNGNSEYYKIKASNTSIYIVTIDSLGVISNNYATCIS